MCTVVALKLWPQLFPHDSQSVFSQTLISRRVTSIINKNIIVLTTPVDTSLDLGNQKMSDLGIKHPVHWQTLNSIFPSGVICSQQEGGEFGELSTLWSSQKVQEAPLWKFKMPLEEKGCAWWVEVTWEYLLIGLYGAHGLYLQVLWWTWFVVLSLPLGWVHRYVTGGNPTSFRTTFSSFFFTCHQMWKIEAFQFCFFLM